MPLTSINWISRPKPHPEVFGGVYSPVTARDLKSFSRSWPYSLVEKGTHKQAVRITCLGGGAQSVPGACQ